MRASTRMEERVRELKAEVERLQWEVVRQRERLKDAETARSRSGSEAATWRRKIMALSDHYRKRIRQLTQWSERLSRERAALDRDRRRLEEEVGRLREERDGMRRSLDRFRREALSWFLGGALEEAPGDESVREIDGEKVSEQKILSLLSPLPPSARSAGA